MKVIEKNIEELLASIKNSEVYENYKEQEEKLAGNPELKARVDQFRANNFRLQNEADRDSLFQVAEQLSRESVQLRRMPEVNAYLDAELAMCKLMQRICRTLAEGIDMHVPEL